MRNRTEVPEPGDTFDVATFIRENDRRLRRRVARCIGHRGGELDDVMQATYVQLWQAATRIESPAQARGYCVLAAANIARDNARRRTPIPVDLDPAAAGLAPDPADLVVHREAVKILAGAVLALTPEQRSVWVSRELHGLTYAAIGSKLSLSPAAVRGLLERARAAVQRHVLAAEALVRDGYQAIVIHLVVTRSTGAPRPRTGSWTQAVLVAPAVVLAASAGPTLPGPVRERTRIEATSPEPATRGMPATPSPVAGMPNTSVGAGQKEQPLVREVKAGERRPTIGATRAAPPPPTNPCSLVGRNGCTPPSEEPLPLPTRFPSPDPSSFVQAVPEAPPME